METQRNKLGWAPHFSYYRPGGLGVCSKLATEDWACLDCGRNLPTNILVIAKILVFVWMIANYLAAKASLDKFTFLANVGQFMGNQKINQNFG
jgi:hypothetical protein